MAQFPTVASTRSSEYIEELERHGFEISMAKIDNPYENARMESFFKTLKYEEVYLCDYNGVLSQ